MAWTSQHRSPMERQASRSMAYPLAAIFFPLSREAQQRRFSMHVFFPPAPTLACMSPSESTISHLHNPAHTSAYKSCLVRSRNPYGPFARLFSTSSRMSLSYTTWFSSMHALDNPRQFSASSLTHASRLSPCLTLAPKSAGYLTLASITHQLLYGACTSCEKERVPHAVKANSTAKPHVWGQILMQQGGLAFK